MWQTLLYVSAFLRIVTPLFVFRYPLEIAILNILILDGFDVYLASKAAWAKRKYFIYDKILDYWWYIFILWYGLGTPFNQVFIALFFYRTIGQIIGFFKEEVLFLFPAIIETYFFGFVILQKFWPNLLSVSENHTIFLIIAGFIALLREYIVHIKKIDVSKRLIGIGQEWKK